MFTSCGGNGMINQVYKCMSFFIIYFFTFIVHVNETVILQQSTKNPPVSQM